MKKLICVIISACLLLSAVGSTALATAKPVLSVDAPSECMAGDTIEVNVVLANAVNYAGFGYNLVYDSSKMSVVSVNYGSDCPSGSRTKNPVFKENMVRTNFAGAENISQNGTILTVTFKVKEYVSGNADFSIDSFKITDENSATIPSTTQSGSITIFEKSLAKVDAPATAQLIVTTANSVTGTGIEANVAAVGVPGFEKGKKCDSTVGDEITLTADATAGNAVFKCWKNKNSNSIVSMERSYKVKTGSNLWLIAEYSVPDAPETCLVDFYNENASIIKSCYVAKGTTVSACAPEEPPTMTGYTFNGWSLPNDTAIMEDCKIVAQYVADATIAPAVNVAGAAVSNCKFNDEIKCADDDASPDPSFSCWARDGKIASYNPNYVFYAWGNTNIEKISDATVSAKPIIILDSVRYGNAYMMEYELPAGYTKIEAGIIFGGMGGITLADYHSKAISLRNTKYGDFSHGQFTAISQGESFARAYLIYSDGTSRFVVYSDAQ